MACPRHTAMTLRCLLNQGGQKGRFEGSVRVSGTMTADGTLTDLKIVKSPGLGLDDGVLKTLKKWKCNPATDNGKNVQTKVEFDVSFRLKR
jgi:TonB family protein